VAGAAGVAGVAGTCPDPAAAAAAAVHTTSKAGVHLLAGVQGHLLLPVRHERLLPGWSQSPNLHAGRQARQSSSRHIVTANALLKCMWAGLQQHANGPRGRSPLVGGAAGLLAVTAATAGGGVAAVAASPAADAWGVKLLSKRPRRVLAR
jgi:hypothetical protein